MNKNQNIMNFYLQNMSSNEDVEKIIASLTALKHNEESDDKDVTKIIKLIMYDGLDISMLTNTKDLTELQKENKESNTKESKISNYCLKLAKEYNEQDINNIMNLKHIYGAMLIALGIESEFKYYLDYKKLYTMLLTSNNQKSNKQCDITIEYVYLINQLEYDLRLKSQENISSKEEFNEEYEKHKNIYQTIPCLRGILEQAKKL